MLLGERRGRVVACYDGLPDKSMMGTDRRSCQNMPRAAKGWHKWAIGEG